MKPNHWPLFVEFVKAETNIGGPDPQFPLLVELMGDVNEREKLWLIGCYAAHHCVPSAYHVWKNWKAEHAVVAEDELRQWLIENWLHLPVRPEMRSHRMPEKRAKCLADFARYAVEWTPERTAGTYQEVWNDVVASVKYFGRYMAIKVLELMRQTVAPHLRLTDLRAKSAWSPRITLAMFEDDPQRAHAIGNREDNSASTVFIVDETAADVLTSLEEEGLVISWFQLQVLLCEYREMLAGGFYPGGSHDEEMDYIKLTEPRFDNTVIYEARKRAFPASALGELNGYHGLRKEQFAKWQAKGRSL